MYPNDDIEKLSNRAAMEDNDNLNDEPKDPADVYLEDFNSNEPSKLDNIPPFEPQLKQYNSFVLAKQTHYDHEIYLEEVRLFTDIVRAR